MNSNCFFKALLILSLPLLFVIFIALNFFAIIGVSNVSLHSFIIVTVIFLIFMLFVPHNAYISSCKIANSLNSTKKDLEVSLENTALTIENKTKSVLSVRDFLQDYFKNIRNDNFAKIATSTFPMLGILGTFIAIAISMPNFTVSNSSELDREISILLSGIGTAFYASIYGIFLSLWWQFFERIGLSKIEKLTLSLEQIYSKYIWSQKELLRFKYNQKAILDNEFINALKSVFNIDFIKELNKEHLMTYEQIIDKSSKSLKEIEESLKNAANSLQNSILELKKSQEVVEAKKSLQENIEEFNKSAKELKILLESFDTGLERALTQIDSELAKAVVKVKDLANEIKE